jgi:two-component system, chemotaxis family, CheB/CheR fusion protein
LKLEANKEFESLLEYIRDVRGFDYAGYKRPTLVRRMGKRCSELGLETFTAYHDYLQVHPDEFAILFDKILINVTGFFRDREAWQFLAEKIVPQITSGGDPIRIWSAGTASGEEAYTAAIVFCEALGAEQFLDRVKIYATDIDEEALGKARSGYTAKDLEDLDPDLRDRYFEPAAGRFAFRQALRRALIFGRHDLMQDAPISRLDLLICRNTLMYFTSEAQGRILARFHYALNDAGYLFLGRAEMLLTHAALFSPVNVKHRVFSKVPRLQLRDRFLLLARAGNGDVGNHVAKQIRLRELAAEGNPNPQVVIDAAGAVAMANNAARRIFDIGPGDIGRQLKDLEISYKPVNLRAPIDQVFRDKRSISLSGVEHMAGEGNFRHYDVQVVPLVDDDLSVVGVSVNFIDVTQVRQLRNELERARQEVETAYEELQSSNEELETTNEELQSTVEELETTNEELQSSNEELETANEELETTNSELQAINTDMRARTDEVAKLNTFLLAITGKIPIAAIVLDDDLAIQVWNEQAAEMWGLRSDEVVGQSLFSLDIGLPLKEIRTMLRSVSRGKPMSDELIVDATNRRGRPVKVRVVASMLPAGEKTAGVVMLIEELKNTKPSS